MKRLVIIRHGKSSWEHAELKDYHRPLLQRGVNNAFTIAKELVSLGVKPDLLLSSPAVRALDTAIIVATNLAYSLDEIKMDASIYEASVPDLIRVLADVDNSHETLLIFGHNPALTGLINQLQDDFLDNLPTCGVVGIELPITEWKQIGQTSGKQLFRLIPKELK